MRKLRSRASASWSTHVKAGMDHTPDNRSRRHAAWILDIAGNGIRLLSLGVWACFISPLNRTFSAEERLVSLAQVALSHRQVVFVVQIFQDFVDLGNGDTP